MYSIDILLVNPKSKINRPAVIPYGIVYIAAYLKKNGINVKIYDRKAQGEPWEKALDKYKPKLVLI